MNKKKVTFAIVLFIILGLFVYAFANPLNDDEMQPEQNNNGEQRNPSSDNSGEGLISDISNNNNNSVNPRRQRRNITRNLNNTNTVVDTAVSLVGDKSSAILELKQYRSEYVYSNDESYNKLIEDYTKKINDSTTIEDIVNNLNDGRDAIDNLIKNDLDAYKESAKKEVKEYAETKDVVSSYEELLNEFNTNVDVAKTKDAIDTLVKEAKEALDELERKDLEAAKTKAIEELNNYKTEEEKDINEIRNSKDETIELINNSKTLEEVNNTLTEGKNKVDEIIANKTFTVIFITKDKEITKEVKYREDAEAPVVKKDFNIYVLYKNVNYKFDGWDKDFKDIRSDITVNAKYRITHAYAKVYLLNEGLEIPSDVNKFYSSKDYKYVGEIRLPLNKNILDLIAKDEYGVLYSDNNKIVKMDEKYKGLPTPNNKYESYNWYAMKFVEDGFHIDGKYTYDHDQELADKKVEAIEDLNNYKVEETNDIAEVKESKDETTEAINNVKSIDDVNNTLTEGKKAIDEIIANKRYKVTFVGKNGKTVEYIVPYKGSVEHAPTDKLRNATYRNVTYKLKRWDKENTAYKNVKSDVTITGIYDITKVVASVYLLKDDIEIPEDKTVSINAGYTHLKNIELDITDEIKKAINDNKYAVVLSSDEDIRKVDKNKELPTKDGKYKEYEFYVMKFCETSTPGFHIDGKLKYDREREFLDKKNGALDDIKKYKSEDEEYIEEISTIKKDFEDNLNNINNIDELNKSVENTKNAIDEAISKKEFTVTFIGIKGKTISTQTVGYKKPADIPEMNKNITEWNDSISLEFLGWNVDEKDLKSIKKDFVVHTKYKVLKATTMISVLKEDGIANTNAKNYYHPYNKPEATKDTYFDLKITKKIEDAVNNYSNEHIHVYETHEQIIDVVKDYPTIYEGNKYKTLKYYVLKLQGDRFHCDAKIVYDKEQEKLDNKKEELNKLIESKEKLDTTGKTKKSVDALNEAIKTAKENVSSNDINKIDESIDALNNIKLVDEMKKIVSIKLDRKGNGVIHFKLKDEFNYTVLGVYEDGSTVVLTGDKYSFNNFNTSSVTTQDHLTATIRLTSNNNVKTTFKYKVKEK
ncbi:MAG: hypothetical protein K6E99_01290 [Bacilli bacterium]|nr:hypothetical protein [Bacilli bacterium]